MKAINEAGIAVGILSIVIVLVAFKNFRGKNEMMIPDHQGWKDKFDDSEYSKRQTEYSCWFHLQSIYTPQIATGTIGPGDNTNTKIRTKHCQGR
jgi:hypothetical protein